MSTRTTKAAARKTLRAPRVAEKATFQASSGNVFADLGFRNAELELAKADLVAILDRRIKELDLTQIAAGKRIGLAQPKLSTLLRGHWQSYSLDRLTSFLNKVGVSVEITTRVESKAQCGRLRVVG
jgi:predicted XRE-type DNA-binding protein